MDHSGAYLVWKYFFPDTDIPLFIRYIEDADLNTNLMEIFDKFKAWAPHF